MGIRSIASRQKGTQKEQEFIAQDLKGLALLPKADRRSKTWPSFSPLSFKNKKAVSKVFDGTRGGLVQNQYSVYKICIHLFFLFTYLVELRSYFQNVCCDFFCCFVAYWLLEIISYNERYFGSYNHKKHQHHDIHRLIRVSWISILSCTYP